MTLAADAPTTDGRENPATDTSRIVHSQDQKTYKSNLNPQPGCLPEDRQHAWGYATHHRRRGSLPKIGLELHRPLKIELDGIRPITEGAEARYRKSGWSCTVR